MSIHSLRFNALPREIRKILAATEAEMRIQQLKMEKARLNKNYRRHCNEINAHIKNLERYLKERECEG